MCHGARSRRWCGRPLGVGEASRAAPPRPASRRATLCAALPRRRRRGALPCAGRAALVGGFQREQPSRAGATGSWGGGTGTAGDRGAAEGSTEGEARPAGLVGDSGGRLPAPSLDWMPNCMRSEGGGEEPGGQSGASAGSGEAGAAGKCVQSLQVRTGCWPARQPFQHHEPATPSCLP